MDFKFLQPGSTFYKIAEWIQRLVYVNLLWILFSLVGLVVLGIMPATAALYEIIRRWNNGVTSFPVFKTFWREYRAKFIKANLLGIIMAFLGYLLFFNIQYYQQQSGQIYIYFYYLSWVLVFFYGITLVHLFPLLANYELKLHHLLKNALFICILNPGYTLMIIAGTAVIGLVFLLLPSLIPFLGLSSVAFFNTWGAKKSFAKTENKIKEHRKDDTDDTEGTANNLNDKTAENIEDTEN